MIPILRVLVPAALLSAAVSGCTSYLQTAPAIAVEPTTHVLLLKTRPGGVLPQEEAQRLLDFIGVASGGRFDAIHVVVVGVNPAARGAVVKVARRAGIPPSKVRELEEAADPRFRFGVRVLAARYTAHPPACPPIEVRGPVGNGFDPAFGCSSLANLAATVNDPKDLLSNPAVPPGDGTRAALAVRKYQSGGAPPADAPRPAGSTLSNGASSP
jgi:pilus biogenesis lipoprotein CpaD